MQKYFIVVSSVFLLSGCVSPWVIPSDKTKQDFKRDSYECEQRHPIVIDDVFRNGGLYGACMEARGWRRQGE